MIFYHFDYPWAFLENKKKSFGIFLMIFKAVFYKDATNNFRKSRGMK